jgi:hypothetical protein
MHHMSAIFIAASVEAAVITTTTTTTTTTITGAAMAKFLCVGLLIHLVGK